MGEAMTMEDKLATKEDIAKLKEDIVRLELATKEDIADLRTELHTARAELTTKIERMGRVVVMWNVGTVIAVVSVVFAILRFAGGGGP
jgi:pheromone shutdown protein TraB